MSLPVFLLADDPACFRRIAGISVLDRLIISTHRAGAERVAIVCGDELRGLSRSDELGVAISRENSVPTLEEPALFVSGQLVLEVSDLKRVMDEGGRLYAQDRSPLPCGVVREWKGSISESLAYRPRIFAEGAACVVRDSLSAAQAEDELWDGLTSPGDGLVDVHFNRPLGRPVSRWLVESRVTSNQVSAFGILLGVAAAYCFTLGLPQWMVLGAVLLQLSAVAGCVDGDLARMGFRETALGKWLHFGGNHLVRLCLFAGMAVGVHKIDESGPALWLGLSAAAGSVILFIILLRPHEHIERFISIATNRDFTVLLLALTVTQRVEWFLWVTAIGVHVCWVMALCAPRRDDTEARA